MKIFVKAREKYKIIPVQVRASFWFLVCSVLQRGISILTTPIFTRILETGDYGQYTVFNSWLDIVSIIVTFRLYYGVFSQGLVKAGDDKDQYASSLQGLALVLNLVWTIIYIAFRSFWNNLLGLTTVQMLAMLVMIWSTGAFRFWAATQRNEFKYRALVVVTLVVSVVKPILGILLVLHSEDKATARILGLAIAEFAGYSWLFFVQLRKGKKFYSAKYWKHALVFNIPLIPHYLSQAVLNSSDRIMIKYMVGVSEAGVYGLAYSISRLLGMLNTALVQTFSPWAYHKLKNDKASDISDIGIVMMILVAGCNMVLIAFAPEIITVFAPKAYHEAIWIIPPVAMSVFFTFSYNLFSVVEFYYEKTKMIMVASIGGAVLNIILNYWLVQIFGYWAAGYTTLFCYLIYCFVHFYFMKRISGMYLKGIDVYNTRTVLLISLGVLVLGFCFLFSYKNIVIRYLLILCFTILIFIKRRLIIYNVSRILKIKKEKK